MVKLDRWTVANCGIRGLVIVEWRSAGTVGLAAAVVEERQGAGPVPTGLRGKRNDADAGDPERHARGTGGRENFGGKEMALGGRLITAAAGSSST